MKRWPCEIPTQITSILFLLCVVCGTSSRLAGDTVYYGTGTDSKVFASNVLVSEELTRPDRVVFWYHDSFEQPIGLKFRSCESAKCRWVKSSAEERHALVETWKAKGAIAVTNHLGAIWTVYDLVFSSTAPPGYLCLGCSPKMASDDLGLHIGGIDGPARRFKFDAIRSIKFVTSSDLDVVLRTGEHVSGYLVVGTASTIGRNSSKEPMRATFTGWQQLDSNAFAEFTIFGDEVNTIEFSNAVKAANILPFCGEKPYVSSAQDSGLYIASGEKR